MREGLPILLIEDSENDIMLVKLALKRAGVKNPVQAAHDGQEAIDYLQGSGPFADRSKFPFPDVIVSDLKMPRMGGFEVLEWLRQHPECTVIPFIVLSASKQEADIQRAYGLGANSYMVKPASLNELQRMVKLACDYWCICEKPEYPRNG
ncbi:MAG: response regulator receiver protein [Pedosphaera sp.]|nr:response regulator receiver protein [Pedosphaera sp.]